MTTEDLILGHFDGTLSSEHEARLTTEMNTSPEARALFEQHKSLHAMLNADAATLAPSSRLDKAVVAAALGAVPEVIGTGAVSWFTGKMIAGISAVVIGGVSVAFLVGSGSDDEKPVPSQPPAPVVRTVPATPAPAAPSVTEEQNTVPNAAQETPAGTQVTQAPASRTSKPNTVREEKPIKRNPLDLGKEDPTVIRNEKVKTVPENGDGKSDNK